MVFAIILLGVATLTGESFFEGAVVWDNKEKALSLFGTRFVFDNNVAGLSDVLVSFNDKIFINGASDALKKAGDFLAEYVSDMVSLFYHISKVAVGAE